MLENLGLSGFAMVGADVGGFLGSPQMDLLTKWIEGGAFQPIDRDHTCVGTKDQEPWVGGAEQEAIRRRYIDTRYELMPYLYTTAETMARTGVPIVRPLFLEFPDATPDRHPIDLDAPAEFLFGADLLVAPPQFPDEVSDYQVVLPPGIWYDYWKGTRIARTVAIGGRDSEQPAQDRKPIKITPSLDVLPVYARGGSVIAEQPLVQSTGETPDGPLTLRVYPDAPDTAGRPCSGDVSQDDGHSYEFEHGAYLRMHTECTGSGAGMRIHVGSHEGSYRPWWHQVKLEVYGWAGEAAPTAMVGGKALPVSKDASAAAWDILLDDRGKGAEVELR